MLDLDNPMQFRQIDTDDMLGHIVGFPEQCRKAWEQARQITLPASYSQAKNAVLAGMGGSAIGGDLVRSLVERECPVPFIVDRNYLLPGFVGPGTLVIASSYSGNTEETLTTSEKALEAGAFVVALTTNGKLAEWAQRKNVPLIRFSYQSQPRAAIGYSFSLVLGIFQALGWIDDRTSQMDEAIHVMNRLQQEIHVNVPTAQNRAKQVADWLHGGIAVVYGADYLSEVARRWKGQFNENAKAWAFFEQMPELNHNAVLGYTSPEALRSRMRVILLRSSLDHQHNQWRFDVTARILKNSGVPAEEVHARGESPIAHMLSAIHFGDYVSYYLSMLYENNPTPVDTITYLKEQLAR